jgi:hypothetical protein
MIVKTFLVIVIIIESKYMQCYDYLDDNGLEDYYFKDILGSGNTESYRTYYFKEFEVKVLKTKLGNYTKLIVIY